MIRMNTPAPPRSCKLYTVNLAISICVNNIKSCFAIEGFGGLRSSMSRGGRILHGSRHRPYLDHTCE